MQDYPNVPESRRRRYEAWLASSPSWQEVPVGFIGKRVIHMGDSVIGLWQKDLPGGAYQQMAVKQALRERDLESSIQNESTLYGLMHRADGNQHVLESYGFVPLDEGRAILPQDVGEVERVFLEYAPGGSLHEWQKYRLDRRIRPTEIELWEIFHCLSRGILTMRNGSEDPIRVPGKREDRLRIVNFDINKTSVLVGTPEEDEEHRGTANVFKLASFRRAIQVPVGQQDGAYHDRYYGRGPSNFLAPEQLRPASMGQGTRPWFNSRRVTRRHGHIVRNLDFGSLTNIWRAGLVMYCLTHNITEIAWPSMQLILVDRYSRRLANGGPTVGTVEDRAIILNDGPHTYSRKLMSTIRECLLIQSGERPDVGTLFATTREGLAKSRDAVQRQPAPLPPVPPPQPYPQPQRPPAPQPAPLPPSQPRAQVIRRRPVPMRENAPQPPPQRNPFLPGYQPPPLPPPRDHGDDVQQFLQRFPSVSSQPQLRRRPSQIVRVGTPGPPQYQEEALLQIPPRQHGDGDDDVLMQEDGDDVLELFDRIGLPQGRAAGPQPEGLPRYQSPGARLLPQYEPPALEEPEAPPAYHHPPVPENLPPGYEESVEAPPLAPQNRAFRPVHIEPPLVEPPPAPPADPDLPAYNPLEDLAPIYVELRRRQNVRRGERPIRLRGPGLPRNMQAGTPNPNILRLIEEYDNPSVLICNVLENDLFRIQRGTIYLTNLPPNETWLEVKARLIEAGVGFPLIDMRLRYASDPDERVLGNDGVRREIPDVATIIVDNPNQLEIGAGLGLQF